MPAGALFAAVTLFNGHRAEYNLKIANPNKTLADLREAELADRAMQRMNKRLRRDQDEKKAES